MPKIFFLPQISKIALIFSVKSEILFPYLLIDCRVIEKISEETQNDQNLFHSRWFLCIDKPPET